MRLQPILFFGFAFLLLQAVAPNEGGSGESYSSVPQKRDSVEFSDGLHVIREKSVEPLEVFKRGEQEVALIATDTGFLPERIYVRKNIPVRLLLTSASASTLCFVMPDFAVSRGMANQEVAEVRFLPSKAGQYRFNCPIKDISGTVIVRD